jgi:TonB family protein
MIGRPSMMGNGRRVPFTLLADGKSRAGFFGAGFGLECLALLMVIWVPALLPQRLELYKGYVVTPITAPPVTAWKPQPAKLKQPLPVKEKFVAKQTPKPEVTQPPKIKILNPVFTSPVARPATGRRNTPKPESPELVASYQDAKPLSLGSSAIPTIRKPREQVQTGGFGDPNGVPATGRPDKRQNIAQAGSYDLPPGPGYGNGTGGAKGARGVIGSAGFGNGVAVGGTGGHPGGGHTVKQGLFADTQVTNEPKVKNTAASGPKTEPVEILFKPKPVYTDQARQKKIEGEVLLEVVFTASGEVRVLRLIQGMGYGLDEAAESAARQIRFRPARAEGQPVDFTAMVHIRFELAY